MSIILCGLPLCGKSRFGAMASKKLRWNFIETDHLIEEAYQQKVGIHHTCRQIFKMEGEEYFRKLESEQIEKLVGKTDCIISTGGGSLLQEKNIQTLKQIGRIIYLQVNIETLLHRLSKKPQISAYLDPNNPRESYIQMYQQRIKTYEQICDFTLNSDTMSDQQIIARICEVAQKV